MTGLTLLYFVKVSLSINTKTDNMKLIKKILLQVLLAVSCITISYADEMRHPVDTIRVMSYNIHTGVGIDGKFDLERIARLITEYNIDIAGLQEVDQGVERTDRVDTMKKLSELTGMYAAFGMAIPFQGGEYGNGILSRFPIIEKRNHPYTFEQTGEHRALLCVFSSLYIRADRRTPGAALCFSGI